MKTAQFSPTVYFLCDERDKIQEELDAVEESLVKREGQDYTFYANRAEELQNQVNLLNRMIYWAQEPERLPDPTVVVEIKGGAVVGVYADFPVQAVVIDHDTDGAEYVERFRGDDVVFHIGLDREPEPGYIRSVIKKINEEQPVAN